MTDDLALPCSTHEDAAAAFQCCECGKHLCHDCAEQSSHLVICRLCGERAITLDELDRASPEGSVFASEPSPDTGPYAPSARRSVADNFPTALPASRQRVQALDHPGLALTNHLLIPAATIAMVAALLFFLLDVRSVFLGGTARLKWIGFWFAVATVLIARYGRMTRDAAQQGCYTSALALATLVAMTYAPYESSQSGLGGPLFNLVLILAIWRFASRLTANLSLEGAAPGINERRSRPSAADRRPGARRRPGANGRPETPNRTNPNVAVARLAVLVLILFAVGEPFLLAGPPAAAERALAAMIVFLFSTGVVLASAWGLHTYQRVQALGGEAPPAAIAGRPLAGALAMLTVLAVALTLPGIDHRGSGQLGP
ncbi:MAG: B-box zinc finger protein, partial [Acidobacteriota bacterium]